MSDGKQNDWRQVLEQLPGGLEGPLGNVLSSVLSALDGGGEREDDTAKLAAALLRTQRLVSRLHHLVATLWEANSHVSAALGACVCWGTDGRCRRCGGQGRPGWLSAASPRSANQATKGEDDHGTQA
jgi:hypothetical protein